MQYTIFTVLATAATFVSAQSASASPSITSTPAGGFTPAPSSTVTAAAGSLPLGAQCNPFVKPSQCANGAECWASNAGIIAACGNFNAACTRDSQCAFNTCNGGLCNGLVLSPSSSRNSTASASSTGSIRPSSASSALGTLTRSGTSSVPSASGNSTRSATGSPSRTSSMTMFTGAAAVATMVPEVMAMVLGVAAWAM